MKQASHVPRRSMVIGQQTGRSRLSRTVNRGAERALHRPSRVHDPVVPGPDRRAHQGHPDSVGADRRADDTFLPARDLLESIPGFSQIIAEVFIAETGGDMTQFPTPDQLASWAGVSPGSNESAGRVKSTKTRPGNRYLKGALGVAALNQAKSKKTYFSARYRRLASTRGPMKAIVAVEHAMLTAAWNMLTNAEFYRDPGADYYTRQNPAKTRARAVRQLEALGYQVTIQPVQQAG